LDGRDLGAQSWDTRPALLTQLLDRCKTASACRSTSRIGTARSSSAGIVAKRRDSRYRSGRCREWIKVKNRAHPDFERAMLALSKRTGSRSR
jgi:ATP-dependent DNA ligase